MIIKILLTLPIILFISGCGGENSGSSYPENTTTQIATISVDGDPSDWASLTPLNTQPAHASLCGSDADIKNIYTAMDSTNAYVMVETYGTPINPAALEINFNYKPGHHAAPYEDYADIHTNVSNLVLSVWTDVKLDGSLDPYPVTSYTVARSNVFEMSISLSEIENPTFFNATYVDIWDSSYSTGSRGCDPTEVY